MDPIGLIAGTGLNLAGAGIGYLGDRAAADDIQSNRDDMLATLRRYQNQQAEADANYRGQLEALAQHLHQKRMNLEAGLADTDGIAGNASGHLSEDIAGHRLAMPGASGVGAAGTTGLGQARAAEGSRTAAVQALLRNQAGQEGVGQAQDHAGRRLAVAQSLASGQGATDQLFNQLDTQERQNAFTQDMAYQQAHINDIGNGARNMQLIGGLVQQGGALAGSFL